MQAVIAFFLTIGKNIVAMMLTKTMVFWALELAAKKSDNKIDDAVLELVRAAYDNDADSFKDAVEKLANKNLYKL